MTALKQFWIGYREDTQAFSVSVHASHANPCVPQMKMVGPTLLPPADSIDGRRLTLDEAREQECLQEAYSIHFFSRQDLVALRKAIDEALKRAKSTI